MKYYIIPEQELEETDDILSQIESETHGWVGDEITKIRGVVNEWRKGKVIDSDKFEEMAEKSALDADYKSGDGTYFSLHDRVSTHEKGFLAALNQITEISNH